jgi:hypothetical protein
MDPKNSLIYTLWSRIGYANARQFLFFIKEMIFWGGWFVEGKMFYHLTRGSERGWKKESGNSD